MTRRITVKPGDVLIFKGCWFPDGWEFDAPAVIYSPVKRYGFGGNAGAIESLVGDVCMALALDKSDFPSVRKGWRDSELKEFAWRGWDRNGFARRKKATHHTFRVTFTKDKNGLLDWEIKRIKP